MTPDQITQLRQLIKEVREMIKCPHAKNVVPCDFCKRTRLLDEALALLPCPTCNGTGIMMRCVVKDDGELLSQNPEPCLDCK